MFSVKKKKKQFCYFSYFNNRDVQASYHVTTLVCQDFFKVCATQSKGGLRLFEVSEVSIVQTHVTYLFIVKYLQR